MAKRKRNNHREGSTIIGDNSSNKKPKVAAASNLHSESDPTSIQIVAGSYDTVLHGIIATASTNGEVEFADSFLFNAHTSAIKCLAISPPSAPVPRQTQKVILASGSTDERINLYHLSAHAPRKVTTPRLAPLNGRNVLENSQNKELGSLLHHASSVSALYFPTRSKLLSSSEDSTIAITRTRDWSLLSTIKAPIPKPQGRPSGDTAPLGGTPAGVNDFAVHPSMKLMISVGKGEKSMRLWNLVTGKKAGVLNFGRDMLSAVGEGRFNTGEGRKVAWGSTDGGEEFCVGFDKGILVFGMDSQPRCKIMAQNKAKLHQLYYISPCQDKKASILATSTEDGRVLFFSSNIESDSSVGVVDRDELPSAKLIAQLGGKEAGVTGRIKDFKTLHVGGDKLFVVTAGSDGAVRLWRLSGSELDLSIEGKSRQVGELLGTYETGNRITCLEAFVMLPSPEGMSHFEAAEEATEKENLQEDSDSA